MRGADILPETSVVSIVDDDHSIRTSVGALVRSLGYTARVFPSAEDFLNSGQIETTDCLIADIQMPGMSGVDLQQALVGKGYKLPMIFITAYPQESVKQQLLAAGALCLLTKPYDGEALVAYIEAALAPRD
jgi:FixJ family two-component response regulator